MSEETDYPQLRKELGEENGSAIMRLGGRFRRKLRLAFDNQIHQHCANEVFEEQHQQVEQGPWRGLWQAQARTVSAKEPQGKGMAPDELQCLYALCELGRRGDAEILALPTILQEQQHPRHGHFHGVEKLDFDVPYLEYPILCAKMRRVSSRIMQPADQIDGCLRDVGNYQPLISHVDGVGQQKDVAAFVEADMADVDVFVSLDGKFIRPFRQIEKKLRQNGVRTHVMRPSELCDEAQLQPIPFPAPNPRQAMGTCPPVR